MPDKVIDIPNVGSIAFPESMSPDQINAAASKLYTDANANHPKPDPSHSWIDKAADWLPTVGGVIGGYAGGVPGAAIGGAAGRGYQSLVQKAGEIPGAVADVARNIVSQPKATLQGFAEGATRGAVNAGNEGALQGGLQMFGEGLGKAASAVAPKLMQSAVKPTVAMLKEYKTTAPKLVQTLLDEGINVSENGLAKLQTLFDATNAEIKEAIQGRHNFLREVAPRLEGYTGQAPESAALRGRLAHYTDWTQATDRVVDKSRVAAQALTTAGKVAEQTNPTRELRAVGRTVEEFMNHPVYKGNLTLPEAQAMKVGTYQQIGKKYGEVSGASIETMKALARGLKEEIAAQVPEVAKLNARDSELMAAMDAVGRRAALAGNKDPIGFAWVTKNPTAFLAAMFDRSAAVKSMLARGMYDQAGRIARVSPQLLRTAVAAVASGSPDAPAGEPETK